VEDVAVERDFSRLGEENKVLDKSGTWFSYKTERLGQGADSARLFLVSHPEVADKIEVELRSLIFKPR